MANKLYGYEKDTRYWTWTGEPKRKLNHDECNRLSKHNLRFQLRDRWMTDDAIAVWLSAYGK